jgi:hypothetical protein
MACIHAIFFYKLEKMTFERGLGGVGSSDLDTLATGLQACCTRCYLSAEKTYKEYVNIRATLPQTCT